MDDTSALAHVLPDVLEPGLRIVFCGTAAGHVSARRGAYYAHPQNRFWPALHAIGLTPRRLQAGGLPRIAPMGPGADRPRQARERHGSRPARGRARGRGLRGAGREDRGRRAGPGSRSRASPPGADTSSAPLPSASSPNGSGEPESGSCRRPRRPRPGTGTPTSTGGAGSPRRRAASAAGNQPLVKCNRRASRRQASPNKTKKFQVKILGLAWISLVLFVRIGPFQ